MSKESLDYQKLCSNYYSSWEEGCCMESCEFYNHNECPVVYVNGLIADLEAKLAEKDKAIENWQTMYQSVMQSCHNSIEEDKRLREQLAEWERDSNATLNEYRAIKYENKQLNKALELAVQQLDDAKDMLRECGKRDWAGILDTSVDYFKARAKEMKDE